MIQVTDECLKNCHVMEMQKTFGGQEEWGVLALPIIGITYNSHCKPPPPHPHPQNNVS